MNQKSTIRIGIALIGFLIAMTAESNAIIAWSENNVTQRVTAQQTAQNTYQGVTLNSYDVSWFDDYTDALYAIPENTALYASKEAMIASNDFNTALSSDGDIGNTTGYALLSGPTSGFGDEQIKHGSQGIPWVIGLIALPTLTHDISLVDVNHDDVLDYTLQISTNSSIVYGTGHEGGSTFTQTGGSFSFQATPIPLTTTINPTNQTIIFNGQFNHEYEVSSTTNLMTTNSWITVTNITSTANDLIQLDINFDEDSNHWKVERK